MTRYQETVLSVIREKGHLSAEEIYLLAKEKAPRITVATVYNALGALSEGGFISSFSANGRPRVYDKTTSSHGHIVCRECGKTEDVFFPEIAAVLTAKTGEANPIYELEVYALCSSCRKKIK